jgi:hypothetical protein
VSKKHRDDDEFPLGEIGIEPGFDIEEDDDDYVEPTLTKKQKKRLRKAKEAEAHQPQRYAVVILTWDREESMLAIEHPFVTFPEATGIVNMADATVRECIENGGAPS